MVNLTIRLIVLAALQYIVSVLTIPIGYIFAMFMVGIRYGRDLHARDMLKITDEGYE